MENPYFELLRPVALVFSSGVLFHRLIWIHGEWDEIFPAIFFLLIALNLVAVCAKFFDFVTTNTLYLGLATEVVHFAGTFFSIVVYRIYFHPLRHIPGPFWAKVSVWWRVKKTWQSHDRHSVMLHGLHQQYGDIVRVAPNQLSINIASAVPLIHGSASDCRKAASYLNPDNPGSINGDRDPHSHRIRRMQWDKALGAGAVMTYTPRILSLASLLVAKIQALDGQSVNISEYIHFFGFDVMGAVGFGKSYNQLETLQEHPAIKTIMKYMRIGVYMMQVPWLHCLLKYIPFFGLIEDPALDFRVYAERSFRERIQNPPKEPDLLTYLLAPSKSSELRPLTLSDLISDSLIFQVGGSDTTTSTSIHLLYRLARHKEIQDALFHEISTAMNSAKAELKSDHEKSQAGSALSIDDVAALLKLPYLEAVINETLRLHPAAPTGQFRTTPSNGLQLSNGDFIPGNVDVSTPTYSLQRDPRYWEQPESFIPERWLKDSKTNNDTTQKPIPRPSMIKSRDAFLPFGIGPYSCAGRSIAYLELKVLIALLVFNFTIDFPEADRTAEGGLERFHRRVLEEWRDYNTVTAARVDLEFVSRE